MPYNSRGEIINTRQGGDAGSGRSRHGRGKNLALTLIIGLAAIFAGTFVYRQINPPVTPVDPSVFSCFWPTSGPELKNGERFTDEYGNVWRCNNPTSKKDYWSHHDVWVLEYVNPVMYNPQYKWYVTPNP